MGGGLPGRLPFSFRNRGGQRRGTQKDGRGGEELARLRQMGGGLLPLPITPYTEEREGRRRVACAWSFTVVYRVRMSEGGGLRTQQAGAPWSLSYFPENRRESGGGELNRRRVRQAFPRSPSGHGQWRMHANVEGGRGDLYVFSAAGGGRRGLGRGIRRARAP